MGKSANKQNPRRDERRRLVRTLSLAPLLGSVPDSFVTGSALVLPLAGVPPRLSLAATPACADQAKATPRQTEGPYFTPQSPQRASLLEEGVTGTRLVLTGQVRGLDCSALAGVMLDFWQADGDGAYHNRDFRLRGHQFTDAQGRYRLETVVPGLYPGRTRHLHVKVQAHGGPVLTTQLYFAGEPQNRNDPIFSPALVMTEAGSSSAGAAGQVETSFDFAIRTA